MTKKYEFIENDTKFFNGKTLRRIRALIDVRDGVKAGDLGGYLESEKNLSSQGQCWVSDVAYVYESARVSGNALVYGRATVFGQAQVSDDAKVFGDAAIRDLALIADDATVYGRALVSGRARLFQQAIVYGTADISGKVVMDERAMALDNATICDYVHMSGHSMACGYAHISGHASIEGNARIMDESVVYGDVKIGGATVLRDCARVSTEHPAILAGPISHKGGYMTIHRDDLTGARINSSLIDDFSGSRDEALKYIENILSDTPEKYRMSQFAMMSAMLSAAETCVLSNFPKEGLRERDAG